MISDTQTSIEEIPSRESPWDKLQKFLSITWFIAKNYGWLFLAPHKAKIFFTNMYVLKLLPQGIDIGGKIGQDKVRALIKEEKEKLARLQKEEDERQARLLQEDLERKERLSREIKLRELRLKKEENLTRSYLKDLQEEGMFTYKLLETFPQQPHLEFRDKLSFLFNHNQTRRPKHILVLGQEKTSFYDLYQGLLGHSANIEFQTLDASWSHQVYDQVVVLVGCSFSELVQLEVPLWAHLNPQGEIFWANMAKLPPDYPLPFHPDVMVYFKRLQEKEKMKNNLCLLPSLGLCHYHKS